MHLTHIIIDDFLSDPMAVRQAALALTYPERPEKAQYPGRNASRALPVQGLETIVSQIVHEPLALAATRNSHAVPRLAMAGEEPRNNVHFDPCHWSVIVGLTPDEHVKGGTKFLRHKPSGLDRAPVFPGEAEKMGFSNGGEAGVAMLPKTKADEADWEELFELPMRFNRAVIFRGYQFHNAGKSFGDSPETGRLVIPFFYDNVQANAG